MKKDIKKDIKEIIQLCILSGVAIAFVFHVNSLMSGQNEKPAEKKQEVFTSADSIKVAVKPLQQKTR